MANQTSETLEAGTILAGRYRVERQLGRGGMGSVYLVQHLHTEQQLALKLLHATVVTDEVALTRFRREARAPARIQSDHVVQVTDADVAPELGGVPFLVMEWLRGHDLEEIVARRGKLPPDEVVGHLRQAARALDKAHGLGIVHRDLKPENLFLTAREDGTSCLKILDFGIAKLTAEKDAVFKATGTGQVFGTPLYMSPEQTKGETEKVCPQTDVWALGIIAHRLLTGREPWTATTLTALIAQIAYEPLPAPSKAHPGTPGGFDAWFQRACAREPAARFGSASEAVTALGRALGIADEPTRSGSIQAPGAGVPSATPSSPRDDAARTAFSATAPAPALSAAHVATTRVSPAAGPSRARLAIVGTVITLASAIAAYTFISSRAGHVAPPPPVPVATGAPSAEGPGPPPVPSVTVTPATPATASAAPSAEPVATAAAHAPEPRHPLRPGPTVPAKAPVVATPPPAPPPPPTPSPPPTPAKVDDPLGSRH